MNNQRQNWPQANWWDRHVAPKMINYCCSMPQVMKRRSLLVPRASGKVLELGAGGGINLQFYTPGKVDAVIGIDPSTEMIAMAEPFIKTAPVPFSMTRAMAEKLPFADDVFDTVLVTFTLCSVSDQMQALAEAKRVLKPDGQLLFLEHGQAPDPGPNIWQRRIEPVWKHIAGGCHLTRPVINAITDAGFNIIEEKREYTPKTPKFLGYVESGVALHQG